MTLSLFTAQSTAALLLQHWRSSERLQALPAALKPETLSQGYDAQDQLFAAAGGRRVGRLSRALVGTGHRVSVEYLGKELMLTL